MITIGTRVGLCALTLLHELSIGITIEMCLAMPPHFEYLPVPSDTPNYINLVDCCVNKKQV